MKVASESQPGFVSARRLCAGFFAALALGAGACGGGEPALDDAEFARRLRLAADALLQQVPAAARAELERCAEARPDDPEVLFQQARLAMLPGEAGEVEARRLVGLVLSAEPDHVPARRALFLLESGAGDAAGAAEARRAVEAAYGVLGKLELDMALAYERRAAPPPLALPVVPEGAPGAADYALLFDGFLALQRTGAYDAVRAVRQLEDVLKRFPELAALRHQFAYALDSFEVRIPVESDPDQPPIRSQVTLDLARAHLERAYAGVLPSTGLATACLRALSEVTLKMGEWEESFRLKELALQDARIQPLERDVLRQRQVLARYKQGRYADALALFRSAFGETEDLPWPRRWLLHVVQQAAGVPAAERKPRFDFRPGLVLPKPGEALAFVDVAAKLGADRRNGLGPTAWGDVDHDGDDDLFIASCDSFGVLLKDDGQRFRDASREVGLGRVPSGFSSTLVDVDGDSWLDLYVGRDGWSGPAPNVLYKNRAGRFEDASASSGLADPGSSFVHTWCDADRDGAVDVFVANGITGGADINALYRNKGDGTFENKTQAAGLAEPRGTRTIGVAAGDYDDDGRTDLFCSGYQTTNRLYHNETTDKGLAFVECGEAAGVRDAQHVSNGYVTFFADLDGDLDLDILRTSLAPFDDVLAWLGDAAGGPPKSAVHTLRCYRNAGAGRFVDGTEELGLAIPIGVMGAGLADLDNDGWLDLYLGTGDPDLGRLEPNRFLENAAGRFRDRTFELGFGILGKGHGVTFLDRDRDGDLEVYAQEGGFVMGDTWTNAFYENLSYAKGNHWLHVTLEGVASNREGIDARVLVTAGGRTCLRERRNGEGFGCSNSPALEFGLGAAERVERLELRWPSGLVQSFDDVPLDARILVREGERWRRL